MEKTFNQKLASLIREEMKKQDAVSSKEKRDFFDDMVWSLEQRLLLK